MTTQERSLGDSRANFLARALEWLRAGYPKGVPREDYVALLGVLRHKLTEPEVRFIAEQLQALGRSDRDPITGEDIEDMVAKEILQPASPEDVVRVSARLAAGGWPLADPPADG